LKKKWGKIGKLKPEDKIGESPFKTRYSHLKPEKICISNSPILSHLFLYLKLISSNVKEIWDPKMKKIWKDFYELTLFPYVIDFSGNLFFLHFLNILL